MNFDLIGKAQAAQDVNNFPNLKNFLVETDVGYKVILTNVVQTLLIVGGAIAVIYLIYGGLLYITASGDAEKATKGRTAIINAIIGIVIIALAYVIITWVGKAIITTGGGA